MESNESTLIVYMPVFHQGYIDLLERHQRSLTVAVVGEELLRQTEAVKEIRALKPETAALVLSRFDSTRLVRVLDVRGAFQLQHIRVIVASDEVTREIARFSFWEVDDITWDTAFLRVDKQFVYSQQPTHYDRISYHESDVRYMRKASEIAQLTSDWWRQVGAVLVKEGNVMYTRYNRHMPSEHTPYAVGDPRDFVEAGTRSELASAAHSEQQVIACAAGDGVALRGTSLYVTVFPCPSCAKSIALSGIKTCYFTYGHASLNGVNDMKQADVELVWIPLN